jgi:hypothetical protein
MPSPSAGQSACTRDSVDTGEWEIIGPLDKTNARKDVQARIKKVNRPEVTEIRSWSAYSLSFQIASRAFSRRSGSSHYLC